MFHVEFGGLRGMVDCVVQVTLRGVGVVGRGLMTSSLVVLCRLVVMPGGMFVVLCCFAMVFGSFFGHRSFSFLRMLGPSGACASAVNQS